VEALFPVEMPLPVEAPFPAECAGHTKPTAIIAARTIVFILYIGRKRAFCMSENEKKMKKFPLAKSAQSQ
jgi:hypothetical protein